MLNIEGTKNVDENKKELTIKNENILLDKTALFGGFKGVRQSILAIIPLDLPENTYFINMKKIILILVLFSTNAKADCYCACIDGRNKAICKGSLNTKPICPPAICR